MAKIYTRTGDDGSTGLIGGQRVRKDSSIAAAIGTADELNAHLGAARTEADIGYIGDEVLAHILDRLQRELFEIGARIALDESREIPNHKWMETEIDHMQGELEPLRNFILPGGSRLAAQLMIARAVCRRFERCALNLTDGPYFIPNEMIRWANRCSDLLFVMARYANAVYDYPEPKWIP